MESIQTSTHFPPSGGVRKIEWAAKEGLLYRRHRHHAGEWSEWTRTNLHHEAERVFELCDNCLTNGQTFARLPDGKPLCSRCAAEENREGEHQTCRPADPMESAAGRQGAFGAYSPPMPEDWSA